MKKKTNWVRLRSKSQFRQPQTPFQDISFSDNTQDDLELPSGLQQSLSMIQAEWDNCADVKYQHLHVQGVPVCAVFVAELIDQDLAQYGVMEPLTQCTNISIDGMQDTLRSMMTQRETKFSSIQQAIADGKVVVLVDGQSESLVVDVSKFPGRAIEASQNEPTIQGPQEAFVENLQMNLALIRKSLRTPKLKVETQRLGTETNTQMAMIYIDGIVKPSLVDEARKRLERIEVDGVTSSNQIREMIGDAPLSPFRTTETTERPDRAMAALLQGRICFVIDDTPGAVMVPAVFVAGLIAAEDYYSHYLTALPLRILRHVMYWTSLLLPALYVALLTYNQDLIPTPLLISLEGQHEGIPFPTVIEALGMQIAFEALREAGLRLPRTIGQSVSIVGALIIGDAAVNANIVSPGMVIIVAAAGVASYTIPSQDLVNTNRVLQFPFMVAASLLGLYGVVALGLTMVIHMVSLRSFGVPYMAPLAPFSWPEMRDTILRTPWWAMNRRPSFYEPVNSTRNATPRPKPPSGGTA